MLNFITNLLFYTIRQATPLLLCTVGGVFVQKAGTMNFALEAAINTSCFASIVFTVITGNPVWGVCSAILSCLLLNALFGVFVVNCKANAVIIGLALNLLMQAVPPYILSAFFDSRGLLLATDYIDLSSVAVDVPILKNIPILSDIFNGHTPLTYATYLIIAVLTVVFYKTKFGIYTQVTGENLNAAEAVGIKTDYIKWGALCISAVCCALSGLNLTFEQVGSYSLDMSSARGLICLSAINCGKKEPVRSCVYSFIFGFTRALQLMISNYVSPDITLVMEVVPYLMIIIVFLVTQIPEARKNTMRIFNAD